MYLMNCFRFPLVSSLLLTGHLPTLSTLLFRISVSFFSLLHWDIRWSAICMPCLLGHSGLNIFIEVMFYFCSTSSCLTVTDNYNFMFLLFWYVIHFTFCFIIPFTLLFSCHFHTSVTAVWQSIVSYYSRCQFFYHFLYFCETFVSSCH